MNVAHKKLLVAVCASAVFLSAGYAYAGSGGGYFSLGTNADVNTNGNSYVAYLFDEIPGFSKFGSYTGNGSDDGPFVYTDFKPKYWLVKPSGIADSWRLLDTGRSSTGNPVDDGLWGDASSAEASNNFVWNHDFLTNGIKVRSSNQAFNSNGTSYVYAAFAESPFKEQYLPYNLTIASSTRFNDDDSAYFSRTPGSAGNRKTWTWSGWVKRGNNLGSNTTIFAGGTGSSDTTFLTLYFTTTNRLSLIGTDTIFRTTSAMFRDPAEWLHIVLSVDTTQSTASNRVKLYINGSEVTAFADNNNPALNADTGVNSMQAHAIGRYAGSGVQYFDGYMSDVYLVDGQALTPSSFGESDTNGNWRPKSYSGTYGTNGFHLDFANASDPGNDVSGNNDWTANNIDATDNVIDTPTNNFATLNPLNSDLSGTQLRNGSLQIAGGNGYPSGSGSTIGVESGKWYVEMYYPTFAAGYAGVGWYSTPSCSEGDDVWSCLYQRGYTPDDGVSVQVPSAGTDSVYFNGSIIGSNHVPAMDSGGRVISLIDLDNERVWFGFATTSAPVVTWLSGCGDPNNGGTGYSIAGIRAMGPIAFGVFHANLTPGSPDWRLNFGQLSSPTSTATVLPYRSAAGGYFMYAPPTGFKALSTANLPSASITKPSNYFEAKTYTGNGSTQSITGLNFQPNFTWIKDRSAATSSLMFDWVRGATNYLSSNATTKELTAANTLTSFNSDGFSLGAATGINTNTNSYISWNWKEGAASGLDVITYTGNGTNRQLSYTLSSAPEFIIVKDRTGANDWAVYHAKNTAAPETDYLLLNSAAATADDNTYWNDALPGAGTIVLTETAMVTGSTTVYGTISKGSGTFMIDHPLDPVNKLLYHSFLESPDVKNLYDGIAALDRRGRVTIRLPKYFLALNKEFRYLASPMSEAMPKLHIKKGVRKKYWLWGPPVFTIAGGTPGGKVSWQVTGIRKDRFIMENPITVEVDKGADQPVDVGECIFPPLCER